MKAAIVHLATRESAEQTLDMALGLIQEAAGRGAELVLLPELWSSGYRFADAAKTPAILDTLKAEAAKFGMVIAGGLLETAGERHANRLHVIGPEGEIARYTKLHLIPAFNEPETLEPGENTTITQLAGFTTGLAICFDLRFPELFRGYALEGASLFLVASAWPAERAAAFELFARSRAAENQAYLLAANHAEAPFGAASVAVDPLGQIVARLEAEGVAVIEMDPQIPACLRKDFPVLSERRPKVYSPKLVSEN